MENKKQSLQKKPQQIKREMEAGAELNPEPVQDAVQKMNSKPRVQRAQPEGTNTTFGGGWGVDGAFYQVDKNKTQQSAKFEMGSLETEVIPEQQKKEKK
ncbi:MAG: hypothetical protein FH758_03305 [Firmicutes bacterium]|nr:hypothetical protein [Bacillota bacterium]